MAGWEVAVGPQKRNNVEGRQRVVKKRKPRVLKIPLVIMTNGEPDTTVGRIGRNEPCPCGSGKKFKKCCEVGP